MTRRGGVIAGENSPAITLFFSGPAQKCAPGPLKKSQPSDAPFGASDGAAAPRLCKISCIFNKKGQKVV